MSVRWRYSQQDDSPSTFDQRQVAIHLVCSINGDVQLRQRSKDGGVNSDTCWWQQHSRWLFYLWVAVQVRQTESVLQDQLTSLCGAQHMHAHIRTLNLYHS